MQTTDEDSGGPRGASDADAGDGGAGAARRYHHGNLREALIDAALDLIEGAGSAPTLRAAARAAGVSHAAPYNHFADREALLAAVAIRGFERLEASVMAARRAAEAGGGDAGAALAATGRAYVAFAIDHPALFRLMFGPLKAGARPEALGRASGAAFDALVRVIGDGMAAGTFRPGDPRAAAFAAWALVHGMAQLAIDRTGPLVPEDRDGIAARLEGAHAVMMEGLRPR